MKQVGRVKMMEKVTAGRVRGRQEEPEWRQMETRGWSTEMQRSTRRPDCPARTGSFHSKYFWNIYFLALKIKVTQLWKKIATAAASLPYQWIYYTSLVSHQFYLSVPSLGGTQLQYSLLLLLMMMHGEYNKYIFTYMYIATENKWSGTNIDFLTLSI